MLYNESIGKTKVDVFSLESLIAWLETQPVQSVYCYANTGHCLLAQFFTAMGKPPTNLGNVLVLFEGDAGACDIPRSFQRVAVTEPHTFGAALTRARALQQ